MTDFRIEKTTSREVSGLRGLFLNENKFQFIHNKCHLYGWADVYVFSDSGNTIGYGSVWGKDHRKDRDTIFEYYLIPDYRKHAPSLFRQFVNACGAPYLECQTNDPLLAAMMFTHATDIHAQSVLFEDEAETGLSVKDVAFIRQPHLTDHPDDRGGYVLEANGEVMATGGFMLNYNFPYADIYLEVKEAYRQRGLGSLMIQELKKEIYKADRVPAARCNIKNTVSRSALLKAGFQVCGYLLEGRTRTE